MEGLEIIDEPPEVIEARRQARLRRRELAKQRAAAFNAPGGCVGYAEPVPHIPQAQPAQQAMVHAVRAPLPTPKDDAEAQARLQYFQRRREARQQAAARHQAAYQLRLAEARKVQEARNAQEAKEVPPPAQPRGAWGSKPEVLLHEPEAPQAPQAPAVQVNEAPAQAPQEAVVPVLGRRARLRMLQVQQQQRPTCPTLAERGLVSSIEPFQKASASKSVVNFARMTFEQVAQVAPDAEYAAMIRSRAELVGLDSVPVAMKYSIYLPKSVTEAYADGLHYEGVVYETIARDIILRRASPHFLMSVHVGVCRGDCCTLTPAEAAIFQQLLRGAAEQEVREDLAQDPRALEKLGLTERLKRWDSELRKEGAGVRVVLTERTSGGTLGRYLRHIAEAIRPENAAIAVEQLRQMLFQLLWSLHQLQLRGINHNDLHYDNVFVDGLPFITHMVYDGHRDDLYFEVETTVFTRIFDFDWAYMRNGPVNDHINAFCRPNGVCNAFNEKFDTYTMLYMWIMLLPTNVPYFAEFTRFFDEVFSRRVRGEWSHTGRICNVVKREIDRRTKRIVNRCDGPRHLSDTELWPTGAMLRHPIFDKYRARRRPATSPPPDADYVYHCLDQ